MTEDQIKHMVSRFLAWKLPENFNPDGGISFKAAYNENTAHPMKHQPSGTNLIDAVQADAMVRHMIEGMPGTPPGGADLTGATQYRDGQFGGLILQVEERHCVDTGIGGKVRIEVRGRWRDAVRSDLLILDLLARNERAKEAPLRRSEWPS